VRFLLWGSELDPVRFEVATVEEDDWDSPVSPGCVTAAFVCAGKVTRVVDNAEITPLSSVASAPATRPKIFHDCSPS